MTFGSRPGDLHEQKCLWESHTLAESEKTYFAPENTRDRCICLFIGSGGGRSCTLLTAVSELEEGQTMQVPA